MTIGDAAKKAEVSVTTVYTYIKQGHLKTVDVGGYDLIYYRDLLRAAWAAKQVQVRNGKIASYRRHGKDISEL